MKKSETLVFRLQSANTDSSAKNTDDQTEDGDILETAKKLIA